MTPSLPERAQPASVNRVLSPLRQLTGCPVLRGGVARQALFAQRPEKSRGLLGPRPRVRQAYAGTKRLYSQAKIAPATAPSTMP